ncbi:MAG: aspartate-semialdehyde dehydrogenase [Planctomycetes bacterium]|nr:aspartate-semialdehyde dehydrogenase [Planctomycetota bacterium]
MRKLNIALVGATGVVGREFLKILAERKFPIKELRLFASGRSAGKMVGFKNRKLKVRSLKRSSFTGVDIAFFTAGGAVSKQWVPVAVKHGAVAIDNTSVFRMKKNVPLVVPEVNGRTIRRHKGIIANPNCCAAPLTVVLKPIHDSARIKRVVVSTYQSVSGAGQKAVREMEEESKRLLRGLDIKRRKKIFPTQIAFNAIPQIPQSRAFGSDGYTGEETKVIEETKKILGLDALKITVTCVRIPVYRGHGESVNIQTDRPLSVSQVRKILRKSKGIKLWDNPKRAQYPTPALVAGQDPVWVGRIRRDPTVKNGLNLWLVGENLRKGAALNAVQIAERLIGRRLHG